MQFRWTGGVLSIKMWNIQIGQEQQNSLAHWCEVCRILFEHTEMSSCLQASRSLPFLLAATTCSPKQKMAVSGDGDGMVMGSLVWMPAYWRKALQCKWTCWQVKRHEQQEKYWKGPGKRHRNTLVCFAWLCIKTVKRKWTDFGRASLHKSSKNDLFRLTSTRQESLLSLLEAVTRVL